MGRPVSSDLQSGFGGGLNTTADEARLADDEVRQSLNFLLTEHGAAAKRLGCRQLHAAALGAAIQAGYSWGKTSGAEDVIVAGGRLYHGAYALPVTYTDEGLLLSATVIPDMVAFRDATATECVYLADGGLLNKWDDTTFTANITNSAACTRLTIYNKRLFGITGEDQNLYWSDLNNGDSLGYAPDGGGVAVIRTFSDQRIVALAALQGELFLLHVSGISKFTGWTQDDINISAGTNGVTGDVGTKAPRCVITLENEIIFLSDRGFYSLSGTGVSPISTLIDDQVSNLSDAQLAASFGLHLRARRELWFYISGVGFFVFQYRLRKWTGPMTGGYVLPVSTCGWDSVDATGAPIGLVGDADKFVKQVQMPGAFTDNVTSAGVAGTMIDALLQLHRLFSESFESEKSWRFAYVLFSPQDSEAVELSWSTQYGSSNYQLGVSGSQWGTGTWGAGTWGGVGVMTFRVPLSGSGTYIDFFLRDTGLLGGGLYSRLSLQSFDMTRRG